MAKKHVVIRTDVHEERVDFEVNGESIAHFSYDAHGSAGMQDARELVRRLCKEFDIKVVEEEGADE
ncbi:hypothetical protein [Paraburkholderia sp. A3RO-2L]|uniref:hypothetical protein n=1 Tax=unclassified Paraburkholderia TaxID=2615204 RepID=UPI0032F102A4|nr:hypothetical protein [Burkholderia vietnamiensis]